MSRFEGKNILITGGTRGIGLAGAQQIANEGGTVIITGQNQARVDALRAQFPAPHVVLQNDAADPQAAHSLAAEVKRVGQLDGVWLNAGYADMAAITKIDAPFFDQMMNTNVRGPILQLAQLEPLLNEGASVVVTASTAAYEGSAQVSVYAATKGAIISLVRCWASELAPRGIRVNALVPGPIDTEFRAFLGTEQQATFERAVLATTALGRAGSAEEAAAVGLFLLSSASTYVTGSQYSVDGGLVMY